jgi:hypothetical protein
MGYIMHGLSSHKLYEVWCNIKRRCYGTIKPDYKHYGGRGIKVCDEWLNSFLSFYNFCISKNWKEGLEIDRIDVNGNYEPSNCQLISHTENMAVGKRRKFISNTSGYTGVYFNKRNNKWQSQITINKKIIYLGSFSTIDQAVEARIQAEIFYFNEQRTNLHYKI